CIIERSRHKSTTDSLPAMFWRHIHAPYDGLVGKFSVRLTLNPDHTNNTVVDDATDDRTIFIQTQPALDGLERRFHFFLIAGTEGRRALPQATQTDVPETGGVLGEEL